MRVRLVAQRHISVRHGPFDILGGGGGVGLGFFSKKIFLF